MPNDDQFQKDLAKEKDYVDINVEQEVSEGEEKKFLSSVARRNKKFLLDLSDEEKERIAKYICTEYEQALPSHMEICDRMDANDDVVMMKRKSSSEAQEDFNYTTPITAVTLEVVHANVMNVFHTPKDIMRVIPTEPNDVPKINKLATFGNWSCVNELNIFDVTDRLFHSSEKNGECPYMMYWEKRYGVEIRREPVYDPDNPHQQLIDKVTQEPVFDEYEEPKLIYNGPVFKVISRKDYIQPNNALMDVLPPWEMVIIRMTADEYYRKQLQGKYYDGTYYKLDFKTSPALDQNSKDADQTRAPGKDPGEFITFFGMMKVNTIKRGGDPTEMGLEELEDELIATVHYPSQTLCSIRKNKFPMKMRPVDLDYMVPDDEGRRRGFGVCDIMDGVQIAYDALFNQYMQGTVQSNSPTGFFSPFGNIRNEPIKLQSGFMFPVADGAKTNIFQFPQPNESLMNMMEIVKFWSQMLFGISDYSAGLESQIDPSAPAKKAEVVLQQGNTRLNLIIKRKNQTLKNIFKRWFLLYRDNMPPNKFMRVAGDTAENPWKFEAVNISDFSLASIPDFEMTGNILNANKQLEFNKRVAIYNLMAQNPFFNPLGPMGQNPQVIQAAYSMTKWLLDSADDSGGVARFLPQMPGHIIKTPQEENAIMLQGDDVTPFPEENHLEHIREHQKMLVDVSVPDEIKQQIVGHIQEHVKLLQAGIMASQMVQGQMGGMNGQPAAGAPSAPARVLPTEPGMERPDGGNPNLSQEQFAGT